MIKRCYIHNFRCLENFELPIGGQSSSLLIGKNGAGKSSVSHALSILQHIARGTNRVGSLVRAKDFSREKTDIPMRFELDVELGGHHFQYVLAFDFPKNFKEPRVIEERLLFDAQSLFTRELSQMALGSDKGQARFLVDWHLVALPIVQERDAKDPISIFKRWLARMLILAPEPGHMSGESSGDTLEPRRTMDNFGEWFTGLIANSPATYVTIVEYLKDVIPDFRSVENPLTGTESRSLRVEFKTESVELKLAFTDLSDGEKCFFVGALVLASASSLGPLFCFWDEPESHLSIPEVRHFVMALRQAFGSTGQFVMTSHHPEAIGAFSEENTFVLSRRSHLEPTQVQLLKSIVRSRGALMDAILLGEIG